MQTKMKNPGRPSSATRQHERVVRGEVVVLDELAVPDAEDRAPLNMVMPLAHAS